MTRRSEPEYSSCGFDVVSLPSLFEVRQLLSRSAHNYYRNWNWVNTINGNCFKKRYKCHKLSVHSAVSLNKRDRNMVSPAQNSTTIQVNLYWAIMCQWNNHINSSWFGLCVIPGICSQRCVCPPKAIPIPSSVNGSPAPWNEFSLSLPAAIHQEQFSINVQINTYVKHFYTPTTQNKQSTRKTRLLYLKQNLLQ